MRILALDSAVGRCSATIVTDGAVVAGYQRDVERGQASVLPILAQDCLRKASVRAADLDLIAVTVGPGSFTGIRGGIALALGLALAAGRPVVGVTVGEALADSLPQLGGRTLWCVTTSRRGRIFLEADDQIVSLAVTELPDPGCPVAIAGGAAADIASRLAARGINVMLTDARLPTGRHIAQVAERRFRGAIRSLPAQPIYVDPPEARPPGAKAPPSAAA
ncbi:MAG TPA: tRNA (adenosine(37)-N6)-threonylcarbamoyltransferase complex dimerization subunit type 1 TsaB [Rhodopila sp.]|jgi:tRNA threonylcarbamoyl adenosine modification protein YeaZ